MMADCKAKCATSLSQTSFNIDNILSNRAAAAAVDSSQSRRHASLNSMKIVRPWENNNNNNNNNKVTVCRLVNTGHTAAAAAVSHFGRPTLFGLQAAASLSLSPLTALYKMTKQNFEEQSKCRSMQQDESMSVRSSNGRHRQQQHHQQQQQSKEADSNTSPSAAAATTTTSTGKRRRKSRTAFSSHQLHELERRFTRQKYLLPADRDATARDLGLTNAQVITWFQNRRAKLKRDLDELRADMDAARSLTGTNDSVNSTTVG